MRLTHWLEVFSKSNTRSVGAAAKRRGRRDVQTALERLEDRSLLTVDLVSTGLPTVFGNSDSFQPSISSDGRYVAFYSDASNLVSGDTNGTGDVFVKDLLTGTITRVSTDAANAQANSSSTESSISSDGRYVAFRSNASNLVTGDTNGTYDVFVKDLLTGTITRVSTDAANAQANSTSFDPSISSDGRYVAFYSTASNLSPDDGRYNSDVFRVSLQTPDLVATVDGSGNLTITDNSGDSSILTVTITAGNLVISDANL